MIVRLAFAAVCSTSLAVVPSSLGDPVLPDIPYTLTAAGRQKLILEGCQREFDDAAFNWFGQAGARPGDNFIVDELSEADGRPAYRCWTAPTLPDGQKTVIAYYLFNDPLHPPKPPPPKKQKTVPLGDGPFGAR